MSKITITLNGEQTKIEKGLTKIEKLYEKSGVESDKKCLYLDKSGDIDIPLSPDDHIIIQGKETIFADDISGDISDNPSVRNSIQFKFNGETIKQGLKKAKVKSNEISGRDKELESSRLFVDLTGKTDDFIPDDITLVVQDTDSYFTVPLSDDKSIDLEECSKKGRRPPKGQKLYKIKIDKEPHKVKTQKIEGNEILALVGKSYREWLLNQKLRGGRRKAIEADEIVDLAQEGIERFETVMKQATQG